MSSNNLPGTTIFSNNNLLTHIYQLENILSNLRHENETLKMKINDLHTTNISSQTELKMYKFKASLFEYVIKEHTKFDIDKVYSIGYNNSSQMDTELIENYADNNSVSEDDVSFENTIETKKEDPLEYEKNIRNTEKEIDEIKKNNFDVSETSILKDISENIKLMSKKRSHKKYIEKLKNYRLKLFGKYNIEDYKNLIGNHIECIKNALKNKNKKEREILNMISKCGLSGLECRLIRWKDYYNKDIEADEIKMYDTCLTVNMPHSRHYIPFDQNNVLEKLDYYSLALLPVEDIINKIMINPYKMNNVCYCGPEDEKDPYRFYRLVKVDGKTRYWQIDYRLSKITEIVTNMLLLNCTSLFRQIYYDIFSDNQYREDYERHATAASRDCYQIIMNIITLSKKHSIQQSMIKMFYKYANHIPSEVDNFDYSSDDRTNKRMFQEEENDEEYILDNISKIMDHMPREKCQEMYETFNEDC